MRKFIWYVTESRPAIQGNIWNIVKQYLFKNYFNIRFWAIFAWFWLYFILWRESLKSATREVTCIQSLLYKISRSLFLPSNQICTKNGTSQNIMAMVIYIRKNECSFCFIGPTGCGRCSKSNWICCELYELWRGIRM